MMSTRLLEVIRVRMPWVHHLLRMRLQNGLTRTIVMRIYRHLRVEVRRHSKWMLWGIKVLFRVILGIRLAIVFFLFRVELR